MGRVSIRSAIQAYLAAQSLPFVGTVYAARPIIVGEGDYEAAILGQLPDTRSSSVLVINLPEGKRQRRSLTGRGSVDDSYVHDTALEVFFGHQSGDGVQAQADLDKLLDAIVVAIRTDPLLGQPAVVWSAGEFETAISVNQDEPYCNADGTTIFIVAVVRFQAWEWISGTGV